MSGGPKVAAGKSGKRCDDDGVAVLLPEVPPTLTPLGWAVLLDILLEAAERRPNRRDEP